MKTLLKLLAGVIVALILIFKEGDYFFLSRMDFDAVLRWHWVDFCAILSSLVVYFIWWLRGKISGYTRRSIWEAVCVLPLVAIASCIMFLVIGTIADAGLWGLLLIGLSRQVVNALKPQSRSKAVLIAACLSITLGFMFNPHVQAKVAMTTTVSPILWILGSHQYSAVDAREKVAQAYKMRAAYADRACGPLQFSYVLILGGLCGLLSYLVMPDDDDHLYLPGEKPWRPCGPLPPGAPISTHQDKQSP
jgi:hypothetical protein